MTEYEAVREGGAGIIDLSALRGRIRVSGSEATMFLNGLITNDVKTLAENRWMPAVFPTVQGRLIGAVRVIRGSDPSTANGTPAPPNLVPSAGPRSETLLNPISVLLAAYAEGHINSYYDVVELSR